MKQNTRSLLLFIVAIPFLAATFIGCKSKPKDSEIKASVESALNANNGTDNLNVDVKDAVVTVTGEVDDANAQSSVASVAGNVKGVKSVNNNVTIAAPPPAPVEITADDPLTAGVRDATKDFPTATASVKDGVISVTGELKSADWKRLKMSLDGLRPKRVDASGLTILK